jgi:hypothetical protein
MRKRHLYKYRAMNRFTRRLFINNEIYFSSPTEFNDPFEGRIYPSVLGTDDDHRKFYENTLQAQGRFTRVEIRKKVNEWSRKGLLKNPDNARKFSRETTLRIIERIGITCLSSKRDDILMYSHYSDYHRGFCLEFDATDKNSFFGKAQKVRYQKNYPVINLFSTPAKEKFEAFLLTKSKQWAYEREWRIVDIQSDGWPRRPGIYQFPDHLLTGVIFGEKMAEGDKIKIRGWLKRRKTPVQLYQASIKDNEFGLDINPIV